MTGAAQAFTFGLVAEARADATAAADLTARVLEAEVSWLESGDAVSLCHWQGLRAEESHLPWRRVAEEAHKRRIVQHGQFRGSPGAFDERRVRLALRLFLALEEIPDAVVLIRDTDAEKGRRESLSQFRAEGFHAFPVALAMPHPKLECWIIAGFDPQTPQEKADLRAVFDALGFDPREHSHRLTAEGKKGKRNAKKILDTLTTDWDRKRTCWMSSDLNLLARRADKAGLGDFLAEIRNLIIPLFTEERVRR